MADEASTSRKSFVKELFSYFDKFLIIDKSVDALLVFVGLIAALSLENWMGQKQRDAEYLRTLSRLHTEILGNNASSKKYNESVGEYFTIATDLMRLVNEGGSESYNGLNRLLDASPRTFEQATFKVIVPEDFLNKSLFSDVFHLYSSYDEVEAQFAITRDAIEGNNRSYFNIYAARQFGTNDTSSIINLNYQYNLATKQMPALQAKIRDIEGTSERILKAIETEFKRYGTSIDSARTYADFYWLSWNSLEAQEYEPAIDFATRGLALLDDRRRDTGDPAYDEYVSYFGRLHKNIVNTHFNLHPPDDSAFWGDRANVTMLLSHLEPWRETGVYLDANVVFTLALYHYTDDFPRFIEVLTREVPLLKTNRRQLDYLLVGLTNFQSFVNRPEVIDLLTRETSLTPRELRRRFTIQQQ